MHVYRYNTIQTATNLRSIIAKTTEKIPEKFTIKILNSKDGNNIHNKIGYRITYDENLDGRTVRERDETDTDRMTYFLFIDLVRHAVILMGNQKHRKDVLNLILHAAEGDHWKQHIVNIQMLNQQVSDFIDILVEYDADNFVQKILMESNNNNLLMPLKEINESLPYYQLDFGLLHTSAQNHPLMDTFVRNAESMGFIMQLSSCKGIRPEKQEYRARFDVKPNYTFRRYVDITYNSWLGFFDAYLAQGLDQAISTNG